MEHRHRKKETPVPASTHHLFVHMKSLLSSNLGEELEVFFYIYDSRENRPLRWDTGQSLSVGGMTDHTHHADARTHTRTLISFQSCFFSRAPRVREDIPFHLANKSNSSNGERVIVTVIGWMFQWSESQDCLDPRKCFHHGSVIVIPRLTLRDRCFDGLTVNNTMHASPGLSVGFPLFFLLFFSMSVVGNYARLWR